jgi:hypothetical protein
MKKAIFCIDDMLFVEGIHLPLNRWNGWAKPIFPIESVKVICEFLKPQLEDKDCLMNGELYLMIDGVVHSKSLDDETGTIESIAPVTPDLVIDGVEYYNIGAGGWIWDDVDVPDFGDDDESRDYWIGLIEECPFKSAGVMATIKEGK